MGNHEFCVDCGASDFHYGRPCNPERLAKHRAEQAARDAYTKRAEVAASELCEKLKEMGYPATLHWNYKHKVEISGYDIIKKQDAI